MSYEYFEAELQNDAVEKELLKLKKEYLKVQMPAEELEKLRGKMEKAGLDKTARSKNGFTKLVAAAVIAFAALTILPNTSATVARAMAQIPVLGSIVKIVTFRDYEYESERHAADIEVPEITVDVETESGPIQEKLDSSMEEINAEIQAITSEIVEHFEAYMEDEEGYQDIVVTSEVLKTTEHYFTLKLICYQGAGSGYQWNYYYTIDLNTGERLRLKDIFIEGADYITPISENIKQQMREQMAADDKVYYWLEDEIEEWNFKEIDEDASFYINENGSVIVGFNEGEVAPMYMGAVEFEISASVLDEIIK